MLQVGDRVRAIWRYKDGGAKKYMGTITQAGDTYTIKYDDGDVEIEVSSKVITKMSSKALDIDSTDLRLVINQACDINSTNNDRLTEIYTILT